MVVGQAGSAIPAPRSRAEMALQTGFAVKGPDPAPFLVKFAGLLRNLPAIEGAAAGRGLFSINPERDGIVRRVPVVMMAQDVLVPSLAVEMLRLVTHSGAILVRTDEAGVRSSRCPGSKCRPTATASSGSISTSMILRVTCRPRTCCTAALTPTAARQARARRHLGDRAPRHQDHPGRARHARRRGARADSRKRADQIAPHPPELRDRGRALLAACPRPRHHRAAPMLPAGDRGRARRAADRRPDRGSRGIFFAAHGLLIDFTYPLIVELADLSGADLRQLFPRAEAAPADPLRLRLLSVAARWSSSSRSRRRSWCSAARNGA